MARRDKGRSDTVRGKFSVYSGRTANSPVLELGSFLWTTRKCDFRTTRMRNGPGRRGPVSVVLAVLLSQVGPVEHSRLHQQLRALRSHGTRPTQLALMDLAR